MRVVVRNDKEMEAFCVVMDNIMSFLRSLSTSIDDIVEPSNAEEYILMLEFDNLPVDINKDENKLIEQFPELYEEWEEIKFY
jgi:hypothetical protein